MKNFFSMIAVLALAFFTTTVFAVDAAVPAAPAMNPAAAAAAKASAAMTAETMKALNGDIVVGTIKKLDAAANTIVIKDQTISVKADDIADLREGDKVKVTLAAGTMNAEKIVPLGKKAAKRAAKKEIRQAKEKAIQAATDTAVEKVSQ